MRVGLQGWGSEGDLRPLVALAARLRAAGHEARLAFTPIDGRDYRPLCASIGLPLTIVPERMAITVHDLARAAKDRNPTRLMKAVLAETFDPYVDALHRAALDLCARSDVVVGGPSCWPLKAAGLETGVPYVAVDYVPGIVPSRLVPPAIFPEWRWLARPTWALMGAMFDMALREAPRRFFAGRGLPPVRHTIPDVVFSEALTLHAASPSFWPPAPDWSDVHCVCGEFFMPAEAETWVPSPSLAAFLAEGPPPALLTLGSWELMVPHGVRSVLVEAARRAKVRAIVQTKSDEPEGRDGDVYLLPWAPHRALVPSCAVVVHHGGAGTTHMALRAGKPAAVVPFILEQRMWAQRVKKVGAGDWLSFWDATPARIAALLRRVMESGTFRDGAAAMARSMAAEDGARVAIDRLERLRA